MHYHMPSNTLRGERGCGLRTSFARPLSGSRCTAGACATACTTKYNDRVGEGGKKKERKKESSGIPSRSLLALVHICA